MIALAGLTAVLLAGCADARRYDGSQRIDLDAATRSFGLDLPSCEVQSLGYAAGGAPAAYLDLSFRAPGECVDRYLADHQAGSGVPKNAPFARSELTDNARWPAYGWEHHAGHSYLRYPEFRTSTDQAFQVIVDRTTQTVYLTSD
jgi:hypothetical protein